MARTAIEGTQPSAVVPPLRVDAAGTSWGAIVGGAVAATAVSLILVLLGSGMGLTVISPWNNAGISATALSVWAIIWLVVTQWISAGVGGYLAGRLRARWTNLPADEVFFRDTAHGFIAWALSLLVAVALLGTTLASIAGSTTQAAASLAGPGVAAAAAGGASQGPGATPRGRDPYTGYLVDRLLRVPAPPGVGAPTTAAETWSETQRILVAGLSDQLSDDDRAYLAKLVANRAGISEQEAQTRVDDTVARIESAKVSAQAAADEARKTAATLAIVGALSLLIGAFIASVAGALGGHLRDEP